MVIPDEDAPGVTSTFEALLQDPATATEYMASIADVSIDIIHINERPRLVGQAVAPPSSSVAPPSAPTIPLTGETSETDVAVIAGAAGGAAVLVFAAMIAIMFYMRTMRAARQRSTSTVAVHTTVSTSSSSSSVATPMVTVKHDLELTGNVSTPTHPSDLYI